ncbi:MAG: tetratricopeptide repeat protein [Leeuwenhoekiella sp.]
MKINRNSFPFFIYFVVCTAFIVEAGYAQKSNPDIDSLALHRSNLINPEDSGNFNQSVEFFKRLYRADLKGEHYLKALNDLELLGYAHYKIGNNDESETYYVQALHLLNKQFSKHARNSKKRIYNMLGMLYRDIKAYDQSIAYSSKSLTLSNSTKDSISVLNNIANALRDSGEKRKAVSTLQKVLLLAKKTKDLSFLGFAHDNLGFAQMYRNDTTGLKNLQTGLNIRISLNDPAAMFSSYRHLAVFHQKQNDIDTALKYAESALQTARKIPDKSYEHEALGLLVSLDNNDRAKRYQQLSDSITSARLKTENRYAALKYDVEKEKQRTLSADLEREKEKRAKTIYQSVFVIAVLLFAGLIYFIENRQRKRRLQAVYKQEEKISKNLHDNVANGIYQVMAQLQQQNAVPEKIIDDLDEVYARTRAISKEHAVVVEADFGDQLQDLLGSFNTDELHVITKNLTSITWESIPKLKKTTLFKVLQELMINAKKHSKASFITLTFRREAKKLVVNYRDNGLGCSLKKQNGLQNVEFRIRAIGGKIIFESEPNRGFRAELVL